MAHIIRVDIWRQTIHTHIHTYGQFRVFNLTKLHVFGLWEAARVSRETHTDMARHRKTLAAHKSFQKLLKTLLLPVKADPHHTHRCIGAPTLQTLELKHPIYTPQATLQAALTDKQSSNTFVFTYSLPQRGGMPRSGNCLLNDLRALWQLLLSS